ncbi:MAG TPA: hypothetical protein VK461_14855 [Acidimicrobiales bacterium]|nr:hypothetical protein [Acidimicrobiales bacterium]
MRLPVALLVLVLSACAGAEAKGSIPDAPPPVLMPSSTLELGPLPLAPTTPTNPNRIAPDQQAAIAALGRVASPLLPSGPNAHGHNHGGPQTETSLSATDRATFDRQWDAAVAAAVDLDTAAKANAAGYVIASTSAPGVGVHFVKWSLIDRPFDPAAPSMLLFDTRGDTPVLAGFSYWLRSDDAPAGFAGDNDHWHQHSGLCIVNGWVDREDVIAPSQCAGTYLGGSDLWMLHAWVVPGHEDRWGEFADANPMLCPPLGGTPDVARCPTAP